jgi:endoglucanase
MENILNTRGAPLSAVMRGITVIVLTLIIGFTLTTCGGEDDDFDYTSTNTPESTSGKTALQYFTENNIKAGWNLGNTLDAVNVPAKAAETAWRNPAASQALFNGVKESGFDIVRIPCTWIGHIGPAPNYTVDRERLRRVDEVIGYAKTAGIKAVIINIHHDGNFTNGTSTWGFVDIKSASADAAKKTEIQDQLSKVWTQIAEYFKNYGDYLIFETLNEVHTGNWGFSASAAEQDILFDWNQAALNAIRATGGNNSTRFVAVPGLGSTEPPIVVAANNRNKLLPNDGSNGTDKLIVSVHYYAPSQYTVAGVPIHTWGSQAERNSLIHEMELLKTNFISKGIAVYIGEWGAPTDVRSSMNQTVKSTHIDYIGSVATEARKNGVLPVYWDDGGNFKMLERSDGRPKTGLWADVLSTMMTAINSTTP